MFFFNDTAPTEIYTLSLHDALPICRVRIGVGVGAGAAENRVLFAIEDDGPGLSPEQRQEVMARGARLDESKPGSGLGLAIVADMAELYQGELSLGNSELGGLSARLKLPLAP